MIINTGQRTDIPAFYAEWFINRLREGFVCVRNPYDPHQVSRYHLDPTVVDVIGFCTKNPAPMLARMDLLRDYGQYWFVTITPYGRDIEPNVPDKRRVLEDFKALSGRVGIDAIGWRYDPILLSDRYTPEYHIRAFGKMAAELDGYSWYEIFFRMLLPLVRPGLVAAALLAFIYCWNSFTFGLMLCSFKVQPITVAALTYIGSDTFHYGQIAVASIIAIVPEIILCLLIQKHLVRGLSFGAVKG